jgi:Xaa-Pro aminopeptidase
MNGVLTPETLPEVQRALRDADLDGWLLYDFRGVNSIATGLLHLEGMATRRVFGWVPREGSPVAITHAIEQSPWRHWPAEWKREIYSSWKSLESLIAREVKGKRIAMEYSAGDAVPYLDRVPAGVLEMVREAGAASILSSGELVSRFYAVWNAAHVASHVRAAETIARIAREALRRAGERARSTEPLTEFALMSWIREQFAAAGLETDHGPNVSVGANAANPHYEPGEHASAVIRDHDIILIDLWAREIGDAPMPYADQTWMASIGPASDEAVRVWEAVRDARDAAIALVPSRVAAGEAPRGADVDDAARRVIESRGYGEYFTHRTGHSIDPRELHGSGPHLDNLESREERLLVPGVAFSIEPGVYIPGRIGMRSEVNVYLEPGRAVVTPRDYQRELMVV